MPTLSAPSWHAALTTANVAFISDDSISDNQQELLRQAKRIRDLKQRCKNPNVWADYLSHLSLKRDPNNRSQYEALLQLYKIAVELVPITGTNRLSADYLGLWLGLAELQEELSLDDARETYKKLRSSGIGKYYPRHHEALAAFDDKCGNLEKAAKHRQEAQRIRSWMQGNSSKRPATNKASSADGLPMSKVTSLNGEKLVEPAAKASSTVADERKDCTKETEEKSSTSRAITNEPVKKVTPVTCAPLRPVPEEQPKRTNKFVPRRVRLDKKPTSNVSTRPLSSKQTETGKRIPLKRSPLVPPKSVNLSRPTTKRSPLTSLKQEQVNQLREKQCTPPNRRLVAAVANEQENVSPLPPPASVSPKPIVTPEIPKPAPRVTTRARTTRRVREPGLSTQTSSRASVSVNGCAYEILSQVGKGGSSKVYKVLSPENEVLALKRVVVSPDNHTAMESYGSEIAHLKRLKGEPTIVQLRDAEVSPKTGTILLVLELGDIDLASLLRREKERHIPGDVLRNYWRQMLTAVSTIHDAKIVHGDLKPANFVSVCGTLKLIDFGIAKAITADDTTKITRDSMAGTPNYMSPEALKDIDEEEETGRRGYRVGRASDIWSLGCILYQMVYGKTPFAHIRDTIRKTYRIMDPQYEITFKHTGNSALDDVLRGCLQRDPAKRLTMKQLKMHPFLQDCASLDVTDFLDQLKCRGYNLQLLDRVSGVPISQHKLHLELEQCLRFSHMPTRTATALSRGGGNSHTPSVSAVTKASKSGTTGNFASVCSIPSASAKNV